MDLKWFLLAWILLFQSNSSLLSQQAELTMSVPAQEDSLNYLLYLPTDYDASENGLPLMIFLHGIGECGNDINLVKKNGPPMMIEEGHQFPFIVASPQCPANTRWSPEVLDQFLDQLLLKYKIDTLRIYLTGLSMGGQGTWNWAKADPARFAAIIPICGWADTTGAKAIKDLPAWVFHGEMDGIISVEESKTMVKVLQDAGSPVKLTLYPESGHDCWTETYANPECYRWLLEHRR